ncbi:tyrosine-type recombinase/integrase [Streptomyces sp. NPDC058200]|uniref:tyrosine-type recombinase/integrase n=1 Tax=Streptomyces sp. NPDC058200 TaxID=3346378 RepID=UPI0036E8A630
MTWWQTELDRDSLLEHVCALAVEHSAPTTTYDVTRRLRRAVPKVLDWLEQWPGTTWQQRWLASGIESTGNDWMPSFIASHGMDAVTYEEPEGRSAMAWMLQGQILAPSMEWVLGQQFNYVLTRLPRAMDPAGHARLLAHCEVRGQVGPRALAYTVGTIGRILLSCGGTIGDITVGDCLAYMEAYQKVRPNGKFDRLFYTLLFELGVFGEHAPDRLRAWTVRGQLTVPELVDRYDIACKPVRDLLVDYFTVRSADLDYSTLRHSVQQVCQLWWKDLEEHHPGIDTLAMTPQMVIEWKERLKTIQLGGSRQGKPRLRQTSVILAVRALYLDIAHFAAHDPVRWSPWVIPSPIQAPGRQTAKESKRATARMHQRTRSLAPTLPVLARAVRNWRAATERLYAQAQDLPVGGHIKVDGQIWLRHQGRQSDGVRLFLAPAAGGEPWDLTREEEYSFWAWAAIETLQETGIRIEELLELTHYSFAAYTLPTTGETVPLLQVTPSKSDQERVILVSPELGEVMAAVIHRVRAGQASIPLISRYDQHEQIYTPRLPFLFQRRRGGIPTPLPPAYIQRVLEQALARSGLTDQLGEPVRYTPHDFRRIFTTDAIRAGLPPHIAAKILGHDDVNTTMGYAAIYPEDVINHHRAYLARRRATRPSEEYRDLTPGEWDEFIAHFELRKVALGTCTRDYGTPCSHEHACIRCPVLRPDPAEKDRLAEIAVNLEARIAEAQQRGWHGEVAGLEATLAAAHDKLRAMGDLTDRTHTYLGMPAMGRRSS